MQLSSTPLTASPFTAGFALHGAVTMSTKRAGLLACAAALLSCALAGAVSGIAPDPRSMGRVSTVINSSFSIAHLCKKRVFVKRHC